LGGGVAAELKARAQIGVGANELFHLVVCAHHHPYPSSIEEEG
jgi:hypothetical protein